MTEGGDKRLRKKVKKWQNKVAKKQKSKKVVKKQKKLKN